MWMEERNGRFRYSERYTDRLSGKKRYVSVTLTKKNDTKAAKILAEKIHEKTRDGDYTLREAADAYLDEHRKLVRPQTYIRNKHSIDYTVELLGGDNLIDRLSAAYIRNKYLNSGKSVRTENENMHRFKTFIRWAYRNDFISSTVCVDKLEPFPDTPKRERIQDKFMNRNELSLLLEKSKDELNRLVTEFLALSGLRIGELIALDDKDVTDVIHVSKTFSAITNALTPGKTLAAERDVHINAELADCISRIRTYVYKMKVSSGTDAPYFVLSKRGERFQYYAYDKWLRENTAAILGRELTPHALRHTHASLLAEAGYPLEAISRRLGHENSKVTREIYLHVTEGTKEKDAAMMDNISILLPNCSQIKREAL